MDNPTVDALSKASLPDTEFVDTEDSDDVSNIFLLKTNVESVHDNYIPEDMDMSAILAKRARINII